MNTDGEGPQLRYEQRLITDAQRNGRVITMPLSMRWLAYKPQSEQFKKGIKGRWQVCSDYGWVNAEFTPETYLHRLDWPEQE